MEILKMNQSHVPAVADLEKKCFSDPWSDKSIGSELTNPLAMWLVAVVGEQLIGYIGSQSVEGEADMMNVAVHPEFRRQGVGRKLIEALICALKEKGVRCLTLEVRASNAPAMAMYEQMGFAHVGRRPNYYRHPREDACIMRKEWKI